EGHMKGSVERELPFDAAESKTLHMRGNSMRENRETPAAPAPDGGADRPGKAKTPEPDMHVAGESDVLIVPTKRANKVTMLAKSSAANANLAEAALAEASVVVAESAEERRATKGNAPQTLSHRTQSRGCESQGLWRVRQAARRDKRMRFTALLHHITPALLRASYWELNRSAVPGIDGERWVEYRKHLEARIEDLHGRVHRGTYRAKPSKRAWIPKTGGRRPLGISALEDKIVQQAVRTVLECVYEEDFLGFSYGFRPGRSCHNALDALWVGLTQRRVNWVLDCDIRGFFEAIDHEWLVKFLEHRIADRRILRLVRKWLRAGVSEDGEWSRTTVGTPQGAVISPTLANVYLHYVLDLWVERWRKRHARGDVIIVRYADDFVLGYQYRDDAQRCLAELGQRMQAFGLELHPEKTRLIEFGRFAAADRQRRGAGKPETFEFLGFTHWCGTRRDGKFTVKRKSMARRMSAKLKEVKDRFRVLMHAEVRTMGRWASAVVRGWMNYHAVPGNRASVVFSVHRFAVCGTGPCVGVARAVAAAGRGSACSG
ncbi:MAG TPA: group II intron reverse transcriptase/maturase, partial [Candidatus Binatia bacterium]|nr:group II intron reverse transcriptase/maturase [Candidatus Binatia bacterium]